MKSRINWGLVLFFYIATIFGLAMCTRQSQAHDWYPLECCSGQDCAPASITPIPGSEDWLITTKHGQAVVNARTVPFRPSPDGQAHACLWGGKSLLCLFLPTGASNDKPEHQRQALLHPTRPGGE